MSCAALAHLERAGHLADGDEAMPAGEAAFWRVQDIDSPVVARRLDATTVAVKTVGDVAIEPFVDVLRTLGIHVGEPAHFTVVLTDNYLRRGLRGLERGSPGIRTAVDAGQAGRLRDLGGPRFPAGDDRLLGVPGPASPSEPRGGGVPSGANG